MVIPPATSSSFSFVGPCGPRPNGKPGAFCCKCGKYVTRHKHIKIKITGIPCLQKNSTVILSEEGFNRNSNRIDSLYQELEEKYNQTSKHTLEWNRRIGKIVGAEDEGLIRCLVCSRQWKWKYRSNMKKTRCSPQILPIAELASSSSHIVIPRDTDRPAPKFRMRTKTAFRTADQSNTTMHRTHQAIISQIDQRAPYVQGHELHTSLCVFEGNCSYKTRLVGPCGPAAVIFESKICLLLFCMP